jgi:DNA-binding transcriptional LysR family regulator
MPVLDSVADCATSAYSGFTSANLMGLRMFPGELRAFHAVAQAGSIRKASLAMGVAPSSVSRQVALLEHQMGTELLRRTAGGVVLTHAGTLVADYARSVVLDYDSLRSDLNDLRGRRRLIRVAAVESSISGGLIQALAEFRSRFERVVFRVKMTPALDIVDEVKRGECDVGLGFCVQPHPDINMVARIPEPIVLVVPADHALARAQSVTIRDLKGLPLALPDLNFGIRRIFDRASHDIGLESGLTPALTTNTFEAMRDFVRCGAGAAVLPRRAAVNAQEMTRLAAIPIEGEEFAQTTIDIVTLRKQRTARIVSSFIEQLLRTFSASVPVRT